MLHNLVNFGIDFSVKMWYNIIGGEEMDFTQILQSIVDVGFPIVCVLICFYYIKVKDEQHNKETSALRESHHEEIVAILDEQRNENNKLVEAINNNTVVMNKLIERLNNVE